MFFNLQSDIWGESFWAFGRSHRMVSFSVPYFLIVGVNRRIFYEGINFYFIYFQRGICYMNIIKYFILEYDILDIISYTIIF